MVSASDDQPVLVLGLPRSGTSMVAGALAACGLWLGETIPATSDNPKGFFENAVLRERINKHILKQIGCDPLGVTRLPKLGSLPRVDNLREVVLRTVQNQGYAGRDSWGFKDAKLTLLWPLWRDHFPGAKWVIVRRPRADVIRSCLKTGFMAQHSKEVGFWERFVDAYEERLDSLKSSGVWWREIVTPDLVQGQQNQLKDLVEALGLDWNQAAVERLIEPRFWSDNKPGG